MNITIEFPPEVEAGLLAQARAEGLGVADYVLNLVRGQLTARPAAGTPAKPAYELPPEEWVRTFEAWARSHADMNLPLLSDEAIGRESIYAERGL